MKLNKKSITSQIAQAEVLKSHAVIYSCLSTIERECKKFGVDYPLDWNNEEAAINFNIRTDRLYVSISNNKVNYDIIMANKNTSISSVKNITCKYSITQILVGYNTELRISFNFSCPLPEEDLYTLRMLGKVETQNNTFSTSSESVICKI